MTIAVTDNQFSLPGGSGSTIPVNITLVAGDSVWVWVTCDETQGHAVSCADNVGSTYSSVLDHVTNSGADQGYSHFSCTNAGGGAATITVTFNAVVSARRIWVFRISGAKTAAALDGHNAANFLNPGLTGNAITASATNANQPALVIAVSWNDNSGGGGLAVPTEGTGFTSIAVNDKGRAEFAIVTTTASQAATFTNTDAGVGADCSILMAIFDQALVWGFDSPAPKPLPSSRVQPSSALVLAALSTSTSLATYPQPSTTPRPLAIVGKSDLSTQSIWNATVPPAVTGVRWDETRQQPIRGKWAPGRAWTEQSIWNATVPPTVTGIRWNDDRPPVKGKWSPGKALNQVVENKILPLQSAYMQWTEPPGGIVRGKWISGRAFNETIRDAILPLQSAYMQWAEPARSVKGTWTPAVVVNQDTQGSLIVTSATLTTLDWAPSAVLGKWISLRPVNDPISSAMLALQSAVMQWDDPPRPGKWAPGKAFNEFISSDFLPLQSAYLQVAEPPARGKWAPGRAFNEFISADILPLQSAYLQVAEPPARGKWSPGRAFNESIAFDAIEFAIEDDFQQWAEPPIRGKWLPGRSFNEAISSDILPLQSAYLQIAEPPALGKWAPGRAFNEFISADILPLQSAVLQWTEPPARGAAFAPNRAPDSFVQASIGFAPVISPWISFADSAVVGKSLTTRAFNEAIAFDAFEFALEDDFQQWSDLPARGRWIPGRAFNEAISSDILALQSAYMQWAEPPARGAPFRPQVSPDTPVPLTFISFAPAPSFIGWTVPVPVRSPWVSGRAFNQDTFAGITQPPPGVYVPWTVDVPPSWKSPPARPETLAIVSAVTVQATTPFTEWPLVAPRGTAVSSRRAEPTQYLPTFIPPPALTTLQWSVDPARGTWTVVRAVSEAVLDPIIEPLGIGAFPWLSDPPPRGKITKGVAFEPFVLGTFIGFAPSPSFIGWTVPAASRQAPAKAPSAPSFFGAPFAPAPTFMGWESDLARGAGIPRAPIVDSFFGSAAGFPTAAFIVWANSLPPARVSVQRAAQPSWTSIAIAAISTSFPFPVEPGKSWKQPSPRAVSADPTSFERVTLVALPALNWTTFELPPRSHVVPIRAFNESIYSRTISVVPNLQPPFSLKIDDVGFFITFDDPGFQLAINDVGYEVEIDDPGFEFSIDDVGFEVDIDD